MSATTEESIPQARNLQTIVTVALSVHEGIETAEEAAQAIHMVPRQGYYYLSAARFLGLVYREGKQNLPTDLGNKFAKATPEVRPGILSTLVTKAVDEAYERIDEVTDQTIDYRLGTLISWSEQVESLGEPTISAELKDEIIKVKQARKQVIDTSTPALEGELCLECFYRKSLTGECFC